MENLITINTTQKGTTVVSARELYDGLGMDKSQWKRWYDKNIVKNTFVKENEDWMGFDTMSNGNPTKDFTITLDFAKRLAMLSRTEKGEEIRSYFIECEKKALLAATPALPSNYKEALQALLEKETENERKALQIAEQNKQLALQAPKVAYVNEVLESQSLIASTQVAMDLGISAITMNARLQDWNMIRKVNGEWVLCADWAMKGYGKSKTYSYNNSMGQACTKVHLYWTEKGRMAIHELFEKKKASLAWGLVAEIEEAVAPAKEYNKKYCIDPKEIYWFAFEKWRGCWIR